MAGVNKHPRVKSASSVLALWLLVGAGGCAADRRHDGPRLTVATYNVNWHVPGHPDTVAAAAETAADVVFLQETHPEWEKLFREELGDDYPHIVFRNHRWAGGLGVLSKWPIEEKAFVQPRAEGSWLPGWVFLVHAPDGPVQVLGVHLRAPIAGPGRVTLQSLTETPGTRLAEIEELHGHVDPSLPTIVLGDFNEGDDGGAVQWLRRKGYDDGLGSRDWLGGTWRWRVGLLWLRGHYDHIMHSPHFDCVAARIITKGASDHYPVTAELRPKP